MEFDQSDFLRIDDPKDTIIPDIDNQGGSDQISARRNSDINPRMDSGAATPRTQGDGIAKITTRKNAGSKMQSRRNRAASSRDDNMD